MRTKVLNTLRLALRSQWIDQKLVKLTRDHYVGSWLSRIPANHYQYSQPTLRRVSHHGINYELDISCLLDWCIYFGLRENSRETLYRHIHEHDVVIDVGVNLGETLLNIAQRVGKDGRVIGFEPDPRNLKKCVKNLSLNNFKQAEIVPLALSDQEADLFISQVDSRNPGMNRILLGGLSEQSVKVHATTLDAFVKTRGLGRIDFIKIDVEGFEGHVLRGAVECFEKFRPAALVEIDDTNLKAAGSSAAEILKWFDMREYLVTRADTGEPLKTTSSLVGLHVDGLCLPKEKNSSAD